jgi:hypothetical protein
MEESEALYQNIPLQTAIEEMEGFIATLPWF